MAKTLKDGEVRCVCGKKFGVKFSRKFTLELSGKFRLEADLSVMPPGDWLVARCSCGAALSIS